MKRKKHQHPHKVMNTTAAESEWMTIPEACMEAKRSKPTIYEWINRGLIQSFVSKTHPESQMGLRLIRRRSLRAFLERQFADAQINEPVVRIPVRPKKEEAAAR